MKQSDQSSRVPAALHDALAAAAVADSRRHVQLVLDDELVDAIDRVLSDGGIDPILPEHRAGALKEMAAAWFRELNRSCPNTAPARAAAWLRELNR